MDVQLIHCNPFQTNIHAKTEIWHEVGYKYQQSICVLFLKPCLKYGRVFNNLIANVVYGRRIELAEMNQASLSAK